jgi:hypothetical protein
MALGHSEARRRREPGIQDDIPTRCSGFQARRFALSRDDGKGLPQRHVQRMMPVNIRQPSNTCL